MALFSKLALYLYIYAITLVAGLGLFNLGYIIGVMNTILEIISA